MLPETAAAGVRIHESLPRCISRDPVAPKFLMEPSIRALIRAARQRGVASAPRSRAGPPFARGLATYCAHVFQRKVTRRINNSVTAANAAPSPPRAAPGCLNSSSRTGKPG